jgi:glycosyltransferase involved in cell wall biosynthesis
VRSLLVARAEPWPIDRGSRIRVAATVRALATMGSVDVVGVTRASPSGVRAVPDGEPVDRWHTVHIPVERSALLRRTRLLFGRVPRQLATIDRAAARSELRRWTDQRYDLIWVYHAEARAIARRNLHGRVVVDLDDLEAPKIDSHRLLKEPVDNPDDALVKRHARRWIARRESGRWSRLQRRMARRAHLALLASELDQPRLGVTGVDVLPNTYPRPHPPLGRSEVATTPVITLVGNFEYAPNRDAVEHLSRDIVPLLRCDAHHIDVRAVGRHDALLPRSCPNVVFTGPVDAMEPELARTDVLVAPLRFGSGTRMKILEAFAHRIPVVATSLGAEGLNAQHEQHLLIADDPRTFADACLRLLHDRHLRDRLTTAAHRLWTERYSPEVFTARVRALATRVLASS